MCNDRPVALAEIVTFARPVTEPALLVDAVHRAITTALRVPDNDPTVWHRSVAPGAAMQQIVPIAAMERVVAVAAI